MSKTPGDPAIWADAAKDSAGRVMIIDDDKGFGENALRFLIRAGFLGAFFSDPEEAIRRISEVKPDAIFLDACLDGPQSNDTASAKHLLRRLKADSATRSVPVFLISGLCKDVVTAAEFKALGAEDFYAKDEVLTTQGPFLRNLRARLLLRAVEVQAGGDDEDGLEDERPPTIDMVVLVVDDEPETAELLDIWLKDQSFRIVKAGNGPDALKAAAIEYPDLVILDLHLPGMDGKEVCRRLRDATANQGHYLPILMLTGDKRLRQELRCLNLGADDFLLKPPHPGRLLARLRGLLRRSRFGLGRDDILRVGSLALSVRERQLTISGRKPPIQLSPKENAALFFIVSAMGRPVPSATIYKRVLHRYPSRGSTTVKNWVSRIRAKLANHSDLIEAVPDEAYRLNIELARKLS